MRIAINISALKTNHKYRGIGAYTKNLIRALKKYKPKNEYIFFTRAANLPKSADLVHYPYFDPFYCTLPLFKKVPTVVTIHDLIPLVFQARFPRGLRGEIKWWIQRFSLKSVSAIITDSENSKRDIIKFTSFLRKKIHVLPLAPGEEFKSIKKSSVVQTIKLKYSLPERFILYVGDVNWNKNIPGLLKAFVNIKYQISNIKKTYQKSKMRQLKLVLVGKAFLDESLKETREINLLIDKLGIKNSILKLGFVSTEDLVAIYNLATVYCQPSFYEGFGLPILEAMACGTPVVVADIPVLREVCGKAPVYVDPYNVDKIAEGTGKALHYDSVGFHSKAKEGLKWVKKFSWKKVAQETVRVYEKATKEY